VLQAIVVGASPGSGGGASAERDGGQLKSPRPLFVIAGACPNSLCRGMQAMLFSERADGGVVDFWWIKPRKDDPTRLEKQTLDLHRSGPMKNDAVRSRNIFGPLAEKFNAAKTDGDFGFGVDSSGRAYIEETSSTGRVTRLLIYFVWQETWSSMWSTSKFMRGKISYQKSRPEAPAPGTRSIFFARPYEIRDGQLSIAPPSQEEVVPSLFPPDSLQEA
jgi:hypothetical protein